MYDPANMSSKEYHVDDAFSLPIVLLQEVILAIIFLASLIGNILVCFTVWKQSIIKKTTWSYLFSLAISDIAVTIMSLPVLSYTLHDISILHNDKICQFSGFSLIFFFLVSLMTLAIISFHKYLCVRYPLHWKATDNSGLSIIVVWLIGIVLAFAPIAGWSSYGHIKNVRQCIPGVKRNTEDLVYISCILVIGFAVPLFTIIYCYSIIYIQTKHHIERMKNHTTCANSLHADADVLNTLILIVLTFGIFWTPFAVCMGIKYSSLETPPYLALVAFYCSYTQAAINPYIYALRHDMFREAFKSALCCSKYKHRDIRAMSTTTIPDQRPALVGFEVNTSVYAKGRFRLENGSTTSSTCKFHENMSFEP